MKPKHKGNEYDLAASDRRLALIEIAIALALGLGLVALVALAWWLGR